MNSLSEVMFTAFLINAFFWMVRLTDFNMFITPLLIPLLILILSNLNEGETEKERNLRKLRNKWKNWENIFFFFVKNWEKIFFWKKLNFLWKKLFFFIYFFLFCEKLRKIFFLWIFFCFSEKIIIYFSFFHKNWIFLSIFYITKLY